MKEIYTLINNNNGKWSLKDESGEILGTDSSLRDISLINKGIKYIKHESGEILGTDSSLRDISLINKGIKYIKHGDNWDKKEEVWVTDKEKGRATQQQEGGE